VLYNFREYVSERKMIRLLHGFLVDHQLLNEITKDVRNLLCTCLTGQSSQLMFTKKSSNNNKYTTTYNYIEASDNKN